MFRTTKELKLLQRVWETNTLVERKANHLEEHLKK